MSRLTDLIREAKNLDAKLGDALEDEVRHLQQRRAFGLNFERHTPEAVDLYGRPVRLGDKVRMLPPRGQATPVDKRLWIVTGGKSVDGLKHAELRDPKTDDVASYPVDDLVVVAEHTDVIYPGLVSTGKVNNGGNKPFHTVIKGENLHVLKALLYTHSGMIDCIYIDPPYNTGNGDWIYNDKYITGDDLYRHSKWLAFMERRLKLARELLTETGVIIVAIGDDEHHRLRMLMDQVFHEGNFISDVVWQGGRKNDSRYVSNGADYMLIYARDESALQRRSTRWRESKPGAEAAIAAGAQIWAQYPGDADGASRAWRQWMAAFKKSGGASDAVTRFTSLGHGGRPMRTDRDLRSPNPRPNLQYDLLHPATGKPVKMHPNGWRYSREVMLGLVSRGRVKFGPDHTSGVGGIDFLDEQTDQVPTSVFERDRNPSGIRLTRLLGSKRFPNPKDHTVLERWFDAVAGKEGRFLDFFGGSGSTLEAIARLNHKDGGSRTCILVTNNEVASSTAATLRRTGHRPGDSEWEEHGVHEYVTKPRIVAVTTGERPDGSTFDDTVDANVEFLTLTYEAPLAVSTNHAFAQIAPLLWLRAGAQGHRIEKLSNGWAVADTYGVVERLDRLHEFVAALSSQPAASMAFIVTDDDRRFQATLAQLPAGVEPVRLYESYLRNFEIDAVRSSR